MVTGHFDVLHRESRLDSAIRDNDHDESSRGELAEEDVVTGVADVDCAQLG